MYFVHESGVFEYDSSGAVTRKQTFTAEERAAATALFIAGDNAAIERLAHDAGATGEPVPEHLYPVVLASVGRDGIYELNLALTRTMIRASVTPDAMITNASNHIDEIDKVVNVLAKRLREWYALHDPELEHAYQDHRAFVEAVLKRTTTRSEDTMGAALTPADIDALLGQARAVQALFVQRDTLIAYLDTTMHEHTPNIHRVAGATIGAKLLALAGGLQRMARMPASTIQLLGAETALFRHLRNKKARPPKHGVIFNHLLLQRSPKALRGKVARTLADKLSIAAKLDYFKGEFLGDTLYAQVEAKTKEEVKNKH
jgi:nucleolar protein 56